MCQRKDRDREVHIKKDMIFKETVFGKSAAAHFFLLNGRGTIFILFPTPSLF
jgi:hypothetical protein